MLAYCRNLSIISTLKIRAAIISVNLFSLLCDETGDPTVTSLGSITKFGGPILYLFVYMFVLFVILVWVDSGSRVRWRRTSLATKGVITEKTSREDVTTAATEVADSDDILRVIGISKSYSGKQVLDDVSLGVSKDTIFALLGPNGAGKTTTFNIIRENFPSALPPFTNCLKVGMFSPMRVMYLSPGHPLSEIHGQLALILVFVLNLSPSIRSSQFESTS